MATKTYFQKATCVLLSLIMSLAIAQPVMASEEIATAETVKVGWYEDSYHTSGENGVRSGYAYEYEQAIASYTGWNYEYINGSWSELLKKLQTGEIDMMAAVSYTDERAETMLFSEYPMGAERYYLYVDLKNSDISAADLSTLNGSRIAVMGESIQADCFTEWEEAHQIQTCHINVDSMISAIEMLQNHEVDGVISTETPIWISEGLSAITEVGNADIYYAISKSRPDLQKKLDNVMRTIQNDNPFYADELYQKYLSAQEIAVLSNEEKTWLDEHGAIKIGWLCNDVGISTFDAQTGKMVGVINDYVKYARNCLDGQELEFELCGFDSFEDEMNALQNGEIDVIFDVSQNPYQAQENNLALSNTVLSLPLAVVTSQNYFDENKTNTVAIESDNTNLEWYISYNYPNWRIIKCESYEKAEDMVRNQEADCLIARSGQSVSYLNDRKLHSTFLMKSGDISFAMRKGNTPLLSIMNKTLKNLQTSKLSGAVTMYEDSTRKVTAGDFIRDNFVAVSLAAGTVFLLVLFAILGLLRKAKIAEAKAEKANAAKTEFLFNMSHDIRTPMNALLGYNSLMKKDLTDPKLLGYQEKIEQSGNLLLSIINNVLDMARIESGKLDVDENYSKVGDILEEVCEVFEGEAKKKHIQLNYEMHIEHMHIMCDITKIREIFTNLISNAIKYTYDNGNVTVKLQELPCSQNGYVKLQTEIIDNGIGMSKEFLPYLFEPFARAHNTTEGKVAGTGLGMPIVKKYIDMMGGTIAVESELCKGTKFTVTMQHRIADRVYYEKQETSAVDAAGILAGIRILLAEDNDLNAEIAQTILEDRGFVVERVEDGVACVAKMEQKAAGSYDVILMDIQMPNMDGYLATQKIRRMEDPQKANIPIIAMTANAFEEDRRMALAKGMNDHIAKPIDADKIVETLLRILKTEKES